MNVKGRSIWATFFLISLLREYLSDMKLNKILTLVVAITTITTTQSQVNLENFSGGNTEAAVFAEMRKKRSFGNDLSTVGSPYLSENFTEAEIFYKGKSLGIYLYRHNAFNDEVEVVETGDDTIKYIKDEQGNFVPADGESSSLAPVKDIEVIEKAKGSVLSLKTISNEDGILKNAYLYKLAKGKHYQLFYQNRVRFKEGVRAASSMVRSTPNRFTHFQDFYILKAGEEVAYFFSGKKKDLSEVIKPEHQKRAEEIISSERLKVKEETDLILLIQELNNLLR